MPYGLCCIITLNLQYILHSQAKISISASNVAL